MAALSLLDPAAVASRHTGTNGAVVSDHESVTHDMMKRDIPLAPEISFPYGFPKPGNYRLFVQIKRAGKVATGIFDALVIS